MYTFDHHRRDFNQSVIFVYLREEIFIRYPPSKPTLVEDPPAESSGVQPEKTGQAITVITSPSPADKQEDPQSEKKV